MTETIRIIPAGTMDCPDPRCGWTNPANWSPGADGYLAGHLATHPRHTDKEWTDSEGNPRRGFDYMHRCADFTYDKDFGAEVITDSRVYPRHWYEDDIGVPIDRFEDELQGWDAIDVHGYESCEGITSGHVYKFVEGGVVVGDVLLTW